MKSVKIQSLTFICVLALSIASYFIGGIVAMKNSPMRNVEIANEENTEDILEMTEDDSKYDLLRASKEQSNFQTALVNSDAVPYRDHRYKTHSRQNFYTDDYGNVRCTLFISNVHGSSTVYLTKTLQTNKRIEYRIDRISITARGTNYIDTAIPGHIGYNQRAMVNKKYSIWLDKDGNQL